MLVTNHIQVFEHERLTVGVHGFRNNHLNALLKLNEYHDFKYFEAIPNGIKFKQYVGIIQVNGLSIEILPKADKNDINENWQAVLLQMLQACGKISATTTGNAHVNRQHLNLLEVYFEMFLQEIDTILRHGLIKKYHTVSENVNNLKGRIDFAKNIQKNIVHKERFYTKHQVYNTNHFIHQVLWQALQIVVQFSRGTILNDKVKRVLMAFPKQDITKITKQKLDNIKLNRQASKYGKALDLARLIILNYSPDISHGEEKMISLLFDMNNLWEEYILVKLSEALNNTDYTIIGQDYKPFIGYNSLKPDIVIRHQKTNQIYVIDTKWKIPYNSANVTDLRQIYTYARFWNAQKTMLLYPGNQLNNGFSFFNNDEYQIDGTSISHQTKLGFVSVLDHSNNLDKSIAQNILSLLEITLK